MSMIRCSECKKEVSSFAETCPHCGYRLKQDTCNEDMASKIVVGEYRRYWIGALLGGIIAIIGGIIILSLLSSVSKYSQGYTTILGGGIGLIIGGIILIPISIYKLKKY